MMDWVGNSIYRIIVKHIIPELYFAGECRLPGV
jgi:hypothetical protein